MKISKISNISFTKVPNKLKTTKQKVRIFNPEPQSDPEKILVVITKNPALFCSGGLELRNISLSPDRGFVQSAYGAISEEE